MKRRLFALAAIAAAVSIAVPAEAAGSTKLYLNQTGDCSTTPEWKITTSASDSGSCVCVNCVMVQGNGFSLDEAFASGKSSKMFTVDASKPLTGTFAVTSSAGISQGSSPVEAAGYISVDFVIKIAKKTIGTVHIEGVSTPATPLTNTFSFKIPASINKVKTNSFSVTTNWIDSAGGMRGVLVSGKSFMTLPTR